MAGDDELLSVLKRLVRTGLTVRTVEQLGLDSFGRAGLQYRSASHCCEALRRTVNRLALMDADYALLTVAFALGEWSSYAPGDEGYRSRRLEMLRRSGKAAAGESDVLVLERWDNFLRTFLAEQYLRPLADALREANVDANHSHELEHIDRAVDGRGLKAEPGIDVGSRVIRRAVMRFARTRGADSPGSAVGYDFSAESSIRVSMLDIREAPAPEEVSRTLHVLPTESVVQRHRRYEFNDEPVQIATAYIPLGVAREIPELAQRDTGPGGTYGRLADRFGGLSLTEHLIVRPATPDEATALRISHNEAIVQIDRLAKTAGRPVEYSRISVRSDVYAFEYEWFV